MSPLDDCELGDNVRVITLNIPKKGKIVTKRTIKTYFGLHTNYDVELNDSKIKLINLQKYCLEKL